MNLEAMSERVHEPTENSLGVFGELEIPSKQVQAAPAPRDHPNNADVVGTETNTQQRLPAGLNDVYTDTDTPKDTLIETKSRLDALRQYVARVTPGRPRAWKLTDSDSITIECTATNSRKGWNFPQVVIEFLLPGANNKSLVSTDVLSVVEGQKEPVPTSLTHVSQQQKAQKTFHIRPHGLKKVLNLSAGDKVELKSAGKHNGTPAVSISVKRIPRKPTIPRAPPTAASPKPRNVHKPPPSPPLQRLNTTASTAATPINWGDPLTYNTVQSTRPTAVEFSDLSNEYEEMEWDAEVEKEELSSERPAKVARTSEQLWSPPVGVQRQQQQQPIFDDIEDSVGPQQGTKSYIMLKATMLKEAKSILSNAGVSQKDVDGFQLSFWGWRRKIKRQF